MSERKLVTVRRVTDVRPISGADRLECAVIEGWTCVVDKGTLKPGGLVVYFETDSFLPADDPRFAFLLKNKSVFNEKEGIRLRAIRLRKQLSEGLALPLKLFPEVEANLPVPGWNMTDWPEEQIAARMEADYQTVRQIDFTSLLRVEKWERPVPTELAGSAVGGLPEFVKKTDQERVQNILNEVFVDHADTFYEVTMKLDGTSMTVYHHDGKLGVCGRNYEFDLVSGDNTICRTARALGLPSALAAFGNIALQGELMGPGIQGNREKLKEPTFFVFDAINTSTRKYLAPADRHALMKDLELVCPGIQHVPVLDQFTKLPASDIDGLLKFAEGKSLVHEIREGVVFKSSDGQFSFKVINPTFSLKEE